MTQQELSSREGLCKNKALMSGTDQKLLKQHDMKLMCLP